MAVIKAPDYIEGISGKVSKEDNHYFSTNKSSGTISMKEIVYDPNKPPTEGQKASRLSFKEKTQVLTAWFDENKPSDSLPKGSELYQQMRKDFKAQHEVGDMYHFVWRKLFPPKKGN